MIIKKEITGEQTFAYIREQLNSDKPLSKCLNQQAIESGSVYTFVPETISENQLYNFKVGGLYPSEKKLINGAWLSKVINETKPHVKDLINEFIENSPRNCCIVEESLAAPTDSWVIDSNVEYVHIKKEMYYFFDKKNITIEKFEQAFNRSGGWYFLCVLSSIDTEKHKEFSAFNKISSELMQTVADNTNAFFVDAYDREGYLMCVRG